MIDLQSRAFSDVRESKFERSSRVLPETPVSSTATTIDLSPFVSFQALGTSIRLSSHWTIPSALGAAASCSGSGKDLWLFAFGTKELETLSPARRLSDDPQEM